MHVEERSLRKAEQALGPLSLNQKQDQREFVYRIDSGGRIRFVNDAWLAFADENGWRTSKSKVLGSVLMEQITDPETQHIYKLIIDRVWEKKHQARFRYRCDSPDCRRLMEMRIKHNRVMNQVEFCSRVIQLERRDPVNLLDPCHVNRSSETLIVCGWCKAVSVDHDWVEVEQAVVQLGILTDQVLPRISHGICPSCSKRMASVGLSL